MTTAHAFGRLFPPSLFLIVGLFLSSFWSPDPVLFVTALITAGLCATWLILSILEVARRTFIESAPSPTTSTSVLTASK